MSLKPGWNVVSSTTGPVHGSQELEVLNLLEVTTVILVQEVVTLGFNELSGDFESDLISPGVDERHGHVIKEHTHLLSSWWGVGLTLLLVNLRVDRILEVDRLGSR